jgi:hypothetical protein
LEMPTRCIFVQIPILYMPFIDLLFLLTLILFVSVFCAGRSKQASDKNDSQQWL